jgi:N6-adenosine-specific RNA methylase IME4
MSEATAKESLPALVDRAGHRLLEARSSAEVLEAKAIAEAALHYAKITKAANETHADCIRITARAEIRMANEIDAGQANKQIKVAGHPTTKVQDSDSAAVSYEDLGISRQRVQEWREVRDAGEEIVDDVISKALSEGRAPTKGEILRAAQEIRKEKAGEKAAKRAEKEQRLAQKIVSLPDQKFGVILADPPWRFAVRSELGMDRSADNHYPTQNVEDICELDIPSVAADDCVLFLWATVPMLTEALEVMYAWDFNYKSQCVWVKDKIGTGYWFRNKHEILLIGTKGNVPAPAMGTQWASVVEAPVGVHSAKPEEFYRLIETYYPNLPKLEMYARSPREGWSVAGYEADGVDDE